MVGRLSFIPAHAALYLLRNALAIPKRLYILRTAPCAGNKELTKYDLSLRAALSSLLNIELSDNAWNQASLPLRWGGIGVRSAYRLAPSAFLASAAGVTALLSSLLPGRVLAIPDPALEQAKVAWSDMESTNCPQGEAAGVQRKWDDGTCEVMALKLREGADERTLARLLASCSLDSGIWLNAIPSATLGLCLNDSALRVAVGLRLGVPLVLPHQCLCGVAVDKFGHHGLACRRSSGRHLRHNLLNDTILRALQSADVPSVREPPGLCRADAKRPDGVTLVPWSRGRCLIWDATCPDTVAASHVHQSSVTAGSAAAASEAIKRAKYASLTTAHEFVPVVIETLGTWGPAGSSFINEVGKRITAKTGDRRSTVFLRQRLSLAVQRGNAVSILGTFTSVETDSASSQG